MPMSAVALALLFKMVMMPPPPMSQAASFLASAALVYQDLPTMKQVQVSPALEDSAVKFLTEKTTTLDQKLAVAAAIANRFMFANVAADYAQRAYKKPLEKIRADELRGDELMVLGILASVSQGPKSDLPPRLLQAAKKKLPESFSVALAQAMINSGAQLEKGDNCAPYRQALAVLRDGKLSIDLRQSLIDGVFDAVARFQGFCPQGAAR